MCAVSAHGDGVGSCSVTVSNPQDDREPMKLSLNLFWRPMSVISKKNTSGVHMWPKVGNRLEMMRVLNDARDAAVYRATLKSEGLTRARGPFLEKGALAEVQAIFKGNEGYLSAFKTLMTFFGVEIRGVRVCDLVRRVRSLQALVSFIDEGSNRADFCEYILSECARLGKGKSEVHKDLMRANCNGTITAFSLGEKIQPNIYVKMDFMMTKECEASVRAFTQTKIWTRDPMFNPRRAHLRLHRELLRQTPQLSDDEFARYLLKENKNLQERD